MNTEEFKSAIKEGGRRFRTDNITIDTGERTFSGRGMLFESDGRFWVDVTYDSTENIPGIPSGIKDRSEFWKVSGLIENQIEFRLEGLPSRTQENFGPHRWKMQGISSCSIDLIPSGWDTLTTAELAHAHRETTKPKDALNTENARDVST